MSEESKPHVRKAVKSMKKFKETGMTRCEILQSRARGWKGHYLKLRRISGEENIVRDAQGLPVALYLSPRRT